MSELIHSRLVATSRPGAIRQHVHSVQPGAATTRCGGQAPDPSRFATRQPKLPDLFEPASESQLGRPILCRVERSGGDPLRNGLQRTPYEVPGISTRTITYGNPDYLAWIVQGNRIGRAPAGGDRKRGRCGASGFQGLAAGNLR